MSLPLLLPGRALVIAGMVALALAACGRRGAPEAPLTSAEIAARQQSAPTRQPVGQARLDDDDEVRETIVPTPALPRRRSRGYTVPKEPFILDPLL
jgi:predicted small lipoprotein YifL